MVRAAVCGTEGRQFESVPVYQKMVKEKKIKPSKETPSGFVDRKEKDVFVHASAVREAGLKYLNEGDELTFEVEDGDKGPSAVKLQKTS